jgi:hypothetical protein
MKLQDSKDIFRNIDIYCFIIFFFIYERKYTFMSQHYFLNLVQCNKNFKSPNLKNMCTKKCHIFFKLTIHKKNNIYYHLLFTFKN